MAVRALALEKNDPHFVADLRNSREALWRAARWLGDHGGFEVIIPALKIRPSIEDASRFSDDGDLFVSGKGRDRERIEVKRRGFTFTDRSDYPFPTVIVDAAHIWDKADPKPFAYLILNQPMTTCAVVKGETFPDWKAVRRMDRHKNREREFYEAPLSCVSFHRLIAKEGVA